MRETSNTSFDQGLLKTHHWSWSCLSYSFISASLILSLIIFVVTLLLDDLDIIRQFVLLAQGGSQVLLQLFLALSLFSSRKILILGTCIINIILGIGFFVSLVSIELSNYLQIYRGQVLLKPAHPSMWYTLLNIASICSLLQSLSNILACYFSNKQRDSLPDLIPSKVLSDAENISIVDSKGISFRHILSNSTKNTPVSDYPMKGYEDDLDLGEKGSYKSDKEFLEVAATYRPPKMHINQNSSLG